MHRGTERALHAPGHGKSPCHCEESAEALPGRCHHGRMCLRRAAAADDAGYYQPADPLRSAYLRGRCGLLRSCRGSESHHPGGLPAAAQGRKNRKDPASINFAKFLIFIFLFLKVFQRRI